MKPIRIVDQFYPDATPAFFLVEPNDERRFRDAIAYCTFIADEYDTGLLPEQVGHLLERFYGFVAAPRQPAEALDMTVERRLYHVRGKPLPMKAALMANRNLEKTGLREIVERFASENEPD
ncbi:hypothetical protein G6L37_04260 [Agrobacterium rubi]|nr:hypothetical protein [Agrobacterium rubi]NTF24565.1 hypothetical protein [Agrobacterium rubi]